MFVVAYLCMFDLYFVSYVVLLLVFRFYRAAMSTVNAALLSCRFFCTLLNVRVLMYS